MLVRHNTKLLEQAIDLLVKRSAIPTLQAEAAAHDKIARASGFRRLATGAAVAIAAIGIGIGVWLVATRDTRIVTTDRSTTAPKDGGQGEKKENSPEIAVPPPKTPPVPIPRPLESEKPSEPNKKTIDFTKFVNVDVPFLGSTWQVTTGHHFNDENDETWDKAWCYTRRLVNGVDVNVELATRLSPGGKPLAPVSAPETLASVELNDDLALQLATKCEWLDDTKFASTDFAESAGRPKPQPPALDELVVQDGWDALGNDLPNLPPTGLTGVTFEECQSRCSADQQCGALTFDRKNSVCFLKSGATILIATAGATMASKRSIEGSLQKSSLVLGTNTVVIGNGYGSAVTTYVDCVMSCATDLRCRGFNFDASKLCTLLDSVRSSSGFKGVTSGRKNGPN